MYKVIAECVDQRSGKRFEAGDTFTPDPTPEQAERLVRAGCIRHEPDKKPEIAEPAAPAPVAAAPRADASPVVPAAPTKEEPVKASVSKRPAKTARKAKRG